MAKNRALDVVREYAFFANDPLINQILKKVNDDVELHEALRSNPRLVVFVHGHKKINMLFDLEAQRKADEEIFQGFVKGNSPVMVCALIEDGKINPNLKDAEGNTSLHHAVRAVNFKMVNLLVSKGARIDIENDEGETPEMLILLSDDFDLEKIKQLHDNGANFSEASSALASSVEHDDIAAYLADIGQEIPLAGGAAAAAPGIIDDFGGYPT